MSLKQVHIEYELKAKDPDGSVRTVDYYYDDAEENALTERDYLSKAHPGTKYWVEKITFSSRVAEIVE